MTKQIHWLEDAGYQVDVLSRDPEHPAASGRRLRIGRPVMALRVAAHALLPVRLRFRSLIERHLPKADLAGTRYDVVIVNDHHLLPWVVGAASDLARGPVVLDLHEVYAGTDPSPVYRMLIGPFDRWLISHVDHGVFSTRMTVAEGIADFYRDEYGIERPEVIRNVAPYQELEPSPVDPERIVLVHHGYAATGRGIELMLDAMLELQPRFVLRLMLMGEDVALERVRQHPAFAQGRVELVEPVPLTEVPKALNSADLEIVFMPPTSPNKVYVLPNKFFEAVQARLGVIVGRNRELVPLVQRHGFGAIVDGWTASDLAATVNALSTADIERMKRDAAEAAPVLSTRAERPRFLAAIGA